MLTRKKKERVGEPRVTSWDTGTSGPLKVKGMRANLHGIQTSCWIPGNGHPELKKKKQKTERDLRDHSSHAGVLLKSTDRTGKLRQILRTPALLKGWLWSCSSQLKPAVKWITKATTTKTKSQLCYRLDWQHNLHKLPYRRACPCLEIQIVFTSLSTFHSQFWAFSKNR